MVRILDPVGRGLCRLGRHDVRASHLDRDCQRWRVLACRRCSYRREHAEHEQHDWEIIEVPHGCRQTTVTRCRTCARHTLETVVVHRWGDWDSHTGPDCKRRRRCAGCGQVDFVWAHGNSPYRVYQLPMALRSKGRGFPPCEVLEICGRCGRVQPMGEVHEFAYSWSGLPYGQPDDRPPGQCRHCPAIDPHADPWDDFDDPDVD